MMMALAMGAVWAADTASVVHTTRSAASVDDAAIGLYEQAPADWLSNGRTYAEQRYSPLARVNSSNVSKLGLAWQASLQSARFGIEATPLVVGGVLYTTSSYSRVFAFDATSGAQLWTFDPQVARDRMRYGCCFPVNRGVAVWKGKIYVAAYDGRLIALDAASGKKIWEVNTTGDTPYYTITGAPRVADGKVVIGNAGADYGTRGFFSAYDAETGRLAWRFYVVPGDPRKPVEHPELAIAARTWPSDYDWSTGGDGNPWESFSYDPESGLLYVGTGNGGWLDQPHNVGKGGDRLFVSSILAVHLRTGRLAWHYQTTPGDMWDYDATQNMVLAELDVGGRARKVLMQASKNGFFYVLDRLTGALISATPYVPVDWAKGVDLKTGRPIPNPAANYTGEPRLVHPSAHGGHNWQGMAFDPRRKLVYIPARDSGFIYSVNVPTWYENARGFPKASERAPKAHGALLAWDPIRGKPAWQVVLDTLNNSGVLATGGGLVVQGTQDGYLRFYSADDGRLLHQVFTGTGIVAPPITYEVNGVQYLAFQAGWSGYNSEAAPLDAPPPYLNDARLIVLKLGSGTPVPVAARSPRSPFLAVDTKQDAKVVLQGAGLYLTYCAICHGHIGEETLVPDLRRMSQATDESFDAIVRGGLLKANGMASFADVLQPHDAAAIRAFIVDWAQRSRRNEPSARQLPLVPGGSDAPRQPGH